MNLRALLKSTVILVLLLVATVSRTFAQELVEIISGEVKKSLPAAEALYRDLHQNPELSLQEFRTASKMADALQKIGFKVTTGVGGNGVVGIFTNGKGPVLMLRTDMDALPVKEMTGLPFASKVVARDSRGIETPVMHACGHDLHMTVWLGTLETLVKLKSRWNGTIVAVAQPAEEVSGGSGEMIADGLYTRFPVPDYALAWHISPDLPAGTVGYYPGPIFAGVNSVDVKIFGVGGHGAMPHKTIDPIVLTARIILDYQTIVSREINPVSPAVVTVGSVHGGSKHNIIPAEVDLQLTIRFFTDDVYRQIMVALKRITEGVAYSAGLTDEQLPIITVGKEYTPPVANDPDLVNRVASSLGTVLGKENTILVDPSTVAEDFGRYGRTPENVKIGLFWLGGANQVRYDESKLKNTNLPALHSQTFHPDFEPSYVTGVTSMTRAVIDLLQTK